MWWVVQIKDPSTIMQKPRLDCGDVKPIDELLEI